MKKILLLLFVMLSLIYTPRVNASTESATSYVLLDQDTNRVLLSKNKDKPMLIASITKIMTCIIALENKNMESLTIKCSYTW